MVAQPDPSIVSVASVDGQRSDHALMVRVSSHDLDALAILIDRHQASMMGLAMTVLKDHEAAETAVANAFHIVWRNAARYTPDHFTVRAWLLGLVARQCGGLRATHAAIETDRIARETQVMTVEFTGDRAERNASGHAYHLPIPGASQSAYEQQAED